MFVLNALKRAGNWQTIFEITSNEEADLHYTLQNPLPKYDTDDEIALYHRFKVTVQNPSGLLNIEEQVITIQMAIYFALTYVLQIVRSTVPQN